MPTHREKEFKFRIPPETAFEIDAFLRRANCEALPLPQKILTSTYYDTQYLTLIRWGITVRYRNGDGNDCWQIKTPVARDGHFLTRDETHIEGSPDQVPLAVLSMVAPLLRRQALVPVAMVRTERQPYDLKKSGGHIEVVDDLVHTSGESSTPVTSREIEIELLEADGASDDLAAALGSLLLNEGAEPLTVSKVARAVGPLASDDPDVPELQVPVPNAPAIDAIKFMASTSVRTLLFSDVTTRRDQLTGELPVIGALRNLRAVIRGFRRLLDREISTFLGQELRWIQQEFTSLKQARDAQSAVEELVPDSTDRTSALELLGSRERSARSSAMAALRSDRYHFLLEDLILFVQEPPVVEAAFRVAKREIRRCLLVQWRALFVTVINTRAPATESDVRRLRRHVSRLQPLVTAAAPLLGVSANPWSERLIELKATLPQRSPAHCAGKVMRRLDLDDPAVDSVIASLQESVPEIPDLRNFFSFWPAVVKGAARIGLEA